MSQADDARYAWYSPYGSSLDTPSNLAEIGTVTDMFYSVQNGIALNGVGSLEGTSLAVTGDVFVRQRNVINVIDSIVASVAPGCGPCGIHGTPLLAMNDSCVCICDSRVWTGLTCETHTCFERGIWNSTDCICEDGYDPRSYCALQVQLPSLLPSESFTCPLGIVGSCPGGIPTYCEYDQRDGCSYVCATEVISMANCSMRRNWSMDECIYLSVGHSACICGGGFSRLTRDALVINYMVCDGDFVSAQCQSLFDRSVCTPDYNIGPQCNDSSCCAELNFTTAADCAKHGCLHSGVRCMFSAIQRIRLYSYKTICQWDTIGTLCLYTAIRSKYLSYYKNTRIGDLSFDRTLIKPIPAASINQWAIESPLRLTSALGTLDYINGEMVYTKGLPTVQVFGYDAQGSVVFLFPVGDERILCLCYQQYLEALDWCDLSILSDFVLHISFTLPPHLVCVSNPDSYGITVEAY